MSFIERLEQTAFHDATITALEVKDGHILLQFENVFVDVDDDGCFRARLDLGGVRSIFRNGEAVNDLHPEGEGSSVIAFERSGYTATLVVDWRSYTQHTNQTCSYSFAFDTFDLRAEKQE